jgi:hypothetical protein
MKISSMVDASQLVVVIVYRTVFDRCFEVKPRLKPLKHLAHLLSRALAVH